MVAFARIIRESEETIIFDAVLRETHEGDVDVTEHPVETGADVADHSRPRLAHLTLEAMVTNTPIDDLSVLSHTDGGTSSVVPTDLVYQTVLNIPIGIPGAALVAGLLGADRVTNHITANLLTPSQKLTRTNAVYSALELIRVSSEVVTILTPLRLYDKMLLTHLSAPREAGTGPGAIIFTIEAREVRFVQTGTATAATPTRKGNKGAQPARPAGLDDSSPSATLLSKTLGKIASYFQ
jgi:hypothetical protein